MMIIMLVRFAIKCWDIAHISYREKVARLWESTLKNVKCVENQATRRQLVSLSITTPQQTFFFMFIHEIIEMTMMIRKVFFSYIFLAMLNMNNNTSLTSTERKNSGGTQYFHHFIIIETNMMTKKFCCMFCKSFFVFVKKNIEIFLSTTAKFSHPQKLNTFYRSNIIINKLIFIMCRV